MIYRALLVLSALFASALALSEPPVPATSGQDATYSLKRVAKVGDVINYKLTVLASVGGIDATLSATDVEKVSKFAESGFTVDQTWKDSKISFNNTEQPGPVIQFSLGYSAKNELKEITGGGPDVNEQYRTWFFLYDALHALRLPDKAVKIGDDWTAKLAPSAANGNIAVDCTYKLDGEETISEIPSLRVKQTAKLTSGGDTSAEMTIWVSKADGSVVKIEGTIMKLTFPEVPVPVDAKYTLVRAS